MFIDSIRQDVRYAYRTIRRSPLFAASVAATIGLGLGILCSGFTLVTSYLLRPVELPNAHELYALSWDTATTTRRRFSLADFDDIRERMPHFAGLFATQDVLVMQADVATPGVLVTGNYFQVLGTQPTLGRWLTPADATGPGSSPVVVLSNTTWRVRHGADPSIVGKTIELGRQRFEVVGVAPQGFGLPGEDNTTFWAPLTMARAFATTDPWADREAPLLLVAGRLNADATDAQARAWFDIWLRQRFPSGTEAAPVAVRVESRSMRVPLTGVVLTLLLLIVFALSLVLLVACANVTNLLLARALARQREIAVRLSLGATRWRIARQLTIESLILAVPASAVGLLLTLITARVFPAAIAATLPAGLAANVFLVPLTPDVRVMALLFVAAVGSAVLVTLAPAIRVTRANLVHASKGHSAMDMRRSRLRTGLVAVQIGACVLFLILASGLIAQSQLLSNPDPGLSYERVTSLRVAPEIRTQVAARLRSDPAVENLAVAWRPPLVGPLPPINVVASATRIEQTAGFMVVSPEYFPLFDIQVVRGRAFTPGEADEHAPVVLVSAATARTLWPGLDPIGQTLDLVPPTNRSTRRPSHSSVRVIGVAEDVMNGTMIEGVDKTCVYFPTAVGEEEMALLVRGRGDTPTTTTAVAAAVNAVQPDAPFQARPLPMLLGAMEWSLQVFSAIASLLSAVGLVLAFSGTYAVVVFLVAQRTREFGIRMALGATVRQIVGRMMGETLGTAAIGIGAGVAVAAAMARAFSSTIPIIPPVNLRTYALGVGIVLAATMCAAFLPSMRTARIDPSKALRVD
jgi:predicted permease